MNKAPIDVDHYADGAWYDAEYVHVGGDIPYYQRVAKEAAGPVLELACGTGRLTFPMVSTGATVHGVDNAPGMIAQAEKRRGALPPVTQARVSFELGDMRTVRVDRKFSDVVLGFNTLMHMLEDEDLAAALATAREHLLPGGFFHLDVHTPLPDYLNRDPAGRFDPQEMVDPKGNRFIVTENNTYEPRLQINEIRFYYQRVDKEGNKLGGEMRTVLRLRVIFPRELDTWIRLAGFTIDGEWEDFERKLPFKGAGGRRVMKLKIR